ncbi:Cloroperoxidase [Pyrenochaeta sp. DS3sAY3a]|nr:Cloroperoxidase [Pyrenochaeta sp. DS3sAY3a]
MKFLSLLTAVVVVYAKPQYNTENPHEWLAPGPNDFRGPCPMMNTLANHQFLPHDGRNITKANAVAALKNGLNFNESLGAIMWEQAIIANPEPNATFFTLDHLNRHNVLEHDASLSRSDDRFGNNHVFNQTIFDSSKQWWTDEIITAKQLAHSKIYRQLESRSTNPDYKFTKSTEEFSLGEVAAPIIVFGDMAAGTVERAKVEYFFQNERLPTELGWQKKEKEITLTDILSTTAIIRNATDLETE